MKHQDGRQLYMGFPESNRTKCTGHQVYIEVYCPKNRCKVFAVAEVVEETTHEVLRHFPRSDSPAHRLTGETLREQDTPVFPRITNPRNIYVDTDWPRCTLCGRHVALCYHCCRLICAKDKASEDPHAPRHFVIDVCPLCQKPFQPRG